MRFVIARKRPGGVIAYESPQDCLNTSAAFAAAALNSSSKTRCSGVGRTARVIDANGPAVMPFSRSPHNCPSGCVLTLERSRARKPVIVAPGYREPFRERVALAEYGSSRAP